MNVCVYSTHNVVYCLANTYDIASNCKALD